MALLPKVRLKTLVSFPASVIDGTGVDVVKENGNYRLDLDFSDFAPPVGGITDPANQNVLAWNAVTGAYALMPIVLFGVGPGMVPEAPVNGTVYGRQNAAWSPITAATLPLHTHTTSQITDFAEATDDRVAALLVGGANVSVTYNDVANTLTIASASGGPGSEDTAIGTTFTPAGNVASGNVQAAIQELDAEKVAKLGDVMTGDLYIRKITPGFSLDAIGTSGQILFWFMRDTQARWFFYTQSSGIESGANVGSDFGIGRCGDFGGFIETALSINRSNGVVAVHSTTPSTNWSNGGLVVSGGIGVAGSLNAAGYTNLGEGLGIGGGNPVTSGTTDSNQFMTVGNTNVRCRFGLYSGGGVWVQPSGVGNYATNYNLTLCPNGGGVAIGGNHSPVCPLHVAGAIYGTSSIDAVGGYYLGSILFAVNSGDYRLIYNTANRYPIQMGDDTDQQLYFNETQHWFRNQNGTINFASVNAAGVHSFGYLGSRTNSLTTATSVTCGNNDSALIFNAAGTVTLTLPAAASFPGRWLNVKTISNQLLNSASSNVKPLATDTAGTAILAATAGKWAALQSDGTNWVVMMAN